MLYNKIPRPHLMSDVFSKSMTILEFLEKVASSNSSSEEDGKMMESLLHKIGYPNAVIVTGIVYLEGRGRPISIQQAASLVLKAVGKK